MTLGDFRSRFASLLGCAGDSSRTTIHIELSVADLVHPRPRDSVVSRIDALWDGVLEFARTSSGRIVREIARDIRWASTLNGVNDHPLGALARLQVFSEGDLTRATAVNGASDEA